MTTTMELLGQGMGLLSHLECEEGGALTPEFLALMNAHLDGGEEKITSIFYVRLQAKTQQEMLKDEISRLAARVKANQRVIDQCNERALLLLNERENFGEDTHIKNDFVSVWIQHSERAEVADGCTIFDVPEDYHTNPKPTLNKAAVKKAAAQGETPPGTTIEKHQTARWG